ncbi:hypothetical protein LguiA_011795 [Lonicera macranthoides]
MTQHKRINPTSLKTKFAYNFLQALKKLNKQSSGASPVRQIKFAADASMASAVGSSRSWSLAVLWRIRNRSRLRRALKKRHIKSSTSHPSLRRNKRSGNPRKDQRLGQEDMLRKLVPGGEAMNMCSLLDETGHYIKCLTTQVLIAIFLDNSSFNPAIFYPLADLLGQVKSHTILILPNQDSG